jgi:hypothetical protein
MLYFIPPQFHASPLSERIQLAKKMHNKAIFCLFFVLPPSQRSELINPPNLTLDELLAFSREI